MSMTLAAIVLTVTSDFHRDRMNLAWHVLVASGLLLTLSALLALRLRSEEWRDRPDKACRLKLMPFATASTWLSLAVLGGVFFFS